MVFSYCTENEITSKPKKEFLSPSPYPTTHPWWLLGRELMTLRPLFSSLKVMANAIIKPSVAEASLSKLI